MPGIAAILATAPSAAHAHQLRLMVSALRGPADDAGGTLVAADLGVQAAWVAPAGSFAARASTTAPLDGGQAPICVAFAGECFGSEMEGESPIARTFEAQADAASSRLNGLFAGLVVDRRRRRAWLFNDRFCSQRLYVFEKSGTAYVASHARALLAVLPELRAFDDTGVAHFLTFGSVLDGRTLFRGLQHLPGGTQWLLRAAGAIERGRYFVPAQWETLEPLTPAAFEAQFNETFRAVVPDYLHHASQLGMSLTGGLDTRMVLAALPPHRRPALTYTYAAEQDTKLLDATIARQAARQVGLPHHVLTVGRTFLDDFGRQLDRTVVATDGCAGVLGTHEIWLSERARELAPLRLTGNYGSEVLRSMSTFKRNGPDDALLDTAMASRVAAVLAEQQAKSAHPITHAAFAEVPWHLHGTLAAARWLLEVRTPYLDNRIVELAYRAPDALRRGAASALRFINANHPALAALATDRGASSRSAGAAGAWRRLVCAATFKLDYWHKEGLPDSLRALDPALAALDRMRLLGRHKFLAYRLWFRRELAAHAAAVVADPRTRHMPYWNARSLDSLVAEHQSGRCNRVRELHAVLTLEAVQRTLLDAAAWPALEPSHSSPPQRSTDHSMTDHREPMPWTR